MLPISTKAPMRFTPETLAGRADAPEFLLAVPTMRDKIALDAAIAAEGVRYPGDAEFAAALREAVRAHVVFEDQPALLDLIDEFDAATEEMRAAASGGARPLPAHLANRIEEIARALRPHERKLAAIEAERGRFLSTAMLVRAELLLVGVDGANAPAIERRAGRLTEACAEAIEARYGRGTMLAIGARTIALTSPTPDDAKNFGSPPRSPSDPAISTAASMPPTDPAGTSSASATTATPA
jgi:hypothetical protein